MTAVIVTGSRDFAHRSLLHALLNNESRANPGPYPIAVLVGDCPTGADAYARGWCARHGAEADLTVFRADWALWRATGGREGGGPARNAEMVASEPKADRCLAFFAPPPALNRGTSGCVALARDAGIEVLEFCRTRPWSEVCEGDVVRGSGGEAWVVDADDRRGGFTLSHEGRSVTARPRPGATVEVVARGPLGRAIDTMEYAGLDPEKIDTDSVTGRKHR